MFHEVSDKEFGNSRIIPYPRDLVWRAYSEAEHLKEWWGPRGFRNTFHEFNFREGGDWTFVMHGSDGKNYDNASTFLEIKKPERIVLRHDCPPHFTATITLEDLGAETKVFFTMRFDTVELCENLSSFCKDKNEENFDRLEAELKRMKFQGLSDTLCP